MIICQIEIEFEWIDFTVFRLGPLRMTNRKRPKPVEIRTDIRKDWQGFAPATGAMNDDKRPIASNGQE